MLQRAVSDKYFNWFLLAACLQIITVALFVFKVLPQPSIQDNPFFVLHHGGDQTQYYDMAEGILAGSPPAGLVTFGLPLLIVPFIVIFNASTPAQIIPVFAALWSLVMFPIGQWLLIQLADRWSKSSLAVIVTILSWTLLPLAIFGILRVIANPIMADTRSVHLTWAQMLSDGPATFFTILLFWLYARAEQDAFSSRWMVFLGVTGGFLALIRMTAVIALALVLAALIWRRQWKGLLIASGCAALTYLPQWIYNWAFWGTPFQSGYSTIGYIPPDGLFNPIYLIRGLEYVGGKLGLAALVAALAVALFALLMARLGLVWLWKRSREAAVMTAAILLFYGLVYGIYAFSWNGGLPRFLMPAFPGFALLGGSTVAGLVEWWKGRRESRLTNEGIVSQNGDDVSASGGRDDR